MFLHKTMSLLCLGLVVAGLTVHAQGPVFKVLHYTETSGFDHQTRDVSLQMVQALGSEHNFWVVSDNNGDSFNSSDSLQQYAVVIFSNTSGNAILNPDQRANFETYINNGGGYLGIHAASDTYRHSTANGGATGTWDWYAELAGASVQNSPNHVSGTPEYQMNKVVLHPITDSLPDPWSKNEEYYYWENGYLNPSNQVLLEVEETVGPNGQVNSYDAVRPMAWYRELSGGGRTFYTALGHAQSNFTQDTLFRKLIRDALLWVADVGVSSSLEPELAKNWKVYPNPTSNVVELRFGQLGNARISVQVSNAAGQLISETKELSVANEHIHRIDVHNWNPGVYLIRLTQGDQVSTKWLVVSH